MLTAIALLSAWGMGWGPGGDHGPVDIVEECPSFQLGDAYKETLDSYHGWPIRDSIVDAGDEIVGCLERILVGQGREVGIPSCEAAKAGSRLWAVKALERIGSPRAETVLLNHARVETAAPVQRSIVHAFGKSLRSARARPLLLSFLQNEDELVRCYSIISLGWIGDRRDLQSMLDALDTLSQHSQDQAAQGFEVLGDAGAVDRLRAILPGLSGSYQSRVREVIEGLTAKDHVHDAPVR